MQGGGVFIDDGGFANFTGCNLHDNWAYHVRARILNLLDSSSIAPLERYMTDCILLHAGRWGPRRRICQLREMQFVSKRGNLRARSHFEPSGAFFQRPVEL